MYMYPFEVGYPWNRSSICIEFVIAKLRSIHDLFIPWSRGRAPSVELCAKKAYCPIIAMVNKPLSALVGTGIIDHVFSRSTPCIMALWITRESVNICILPFTNV